jgi:hypothetical protein
MTDHEHDGAECHCSLAADLELCLGDGWHAGTGVNDDGTVWPWLVSPEPDPANRLQSWPEHELLGPLPWSFERHFHLVNAGSWAPEYSCGAPTQSGRPCRSGVSAPGGHCWHHRPQLRESTPR